MAQPLTIARPYAKAIFDLVSQNEEAQHQWQIFLSVASEIMSNQEVAHNLNRPNFLMEIEAWVQEWLSQNRKTAMTEEELNTLRLLAKHGRLPILPQIFEEFVALCSKSNNAVIVQVRTASPLDQDSEQQLCETIAKKTGKEVVLEVEQDESLLAGVVIEYDGQVIDQSMKGRLAQFARKIDD